MRTTNKTTRYIVILVVIIIIMGCIFSLAIVSQSHTSVIDAVKTHKETHVVKPSLVEKLHATAGKDPLSLADKTGKPIEDFRLSTALICIDKKYKPVGEKLIALKNNNADAATVRTEIDKEFDDLTSLEARSLALNWWRNAYGRAIPPRDPGIGTPPVQHHAMKRRHSK